VGGRVAGNVAIDEVRRARRRQETPEAAGPLTADSAEEATLRLALGAALAGLSTRQREVISLRYLADLDEAEVSRALGISVNSSRSTRRKARRPCASGSADHRR
jgi:RNA polymerase sigma factor (sigma-70 family)